MKTLSLAIRAGPARDPAAGSPSREDGAPRRGMGVRGPSDVDRVLRTGIAPLGPDPRVRRIPQYRFRRPLA